MKFLFLIAILFLTDATAEKQSCSFDLPLVSIISTNFIRSNSRVDSFKNQNKIEISDIAKSVFLGQVCFSGNVCLKTFEVKSQTEWPRVVKVVSLMNKQMKLNSHQASFLKEINSSEIDSFVGFSAKEIEHEKKKGAAGQDFFETFDSSLQDADVGLYQLNK